MRLLLDSHVALWWLGSSMMLGPRCADQIFASTEVFVSAVTPWELGIKRSRGKLAYRDGLVRALREAGFNMLAITPEHAELAPDLPPHHRDPFDRILVAQARHESLVLVTADATFRQYDIEILDARR